MDSALKDCIFKVQAAKAALAQSNKNLIEYVFRVCPLGNYCLLVTIDPDKLQGRLSPDFEFEACVSLQILHPVSMEEAHLSPTTSDSVTLQELTKIRRILESGQLPERDDTLTKRFIEVMEMKYSGEQHG
jgi:hypothetical protein